MEDNTKGPLIHLNGTGFNTLESEYRHAVISIDSALKAANDATMHKRDYYPLGDQAWEEARAEFLQNIKRLQDVRDYFQVMLIRIVQQRKD